jgi:hypothetical protein
MFRPFMEINLSFPSRPVPWATKPPVQQAPVLFSEGKAAGAVVLIIHSF